MTPSPTYLGEGEDAFHGPLGHDEPRMQNRPRTISLCLNIDGFVRYNRYPRMYDIFQKDDGTPLTPAEARTFLALEKAKGRHVIPMSAECGNPCKHAGNGCTGFDYGELGGCPGRYYDAAREA